MKFKHIFLVVILSTLFFQLSKADWYDNHLAFNLAVDCSSFFNTGIEASSTPNPNISNWINELEEQCNGKSTIAYPEPVSLSEACPVVNQSPTQSFVIYNDLVRINDCGDSFSLFD